MIQTLAVLFLNLLAGLYGSKKNIRAFRKNDKFQSIFKVCKKNGATLVFHYTLPEGMKYFVKYLTDLGEKYNFVDSNTKCNTV
jgi:hypothetical protein